MSHLFRSTVYKTLDGKRIKATSALDLAEQMWAQAHFSDAATLNEYMAEVSERVWEYSNHNVRTASAFVFVEDLLKAGQLTVIDKL